MTTDVLDAPVSTEIAEYSPTAAALVALRNRLENVAYDLSTGRGIDIAKRDRAEIRDLRVSLEKKRVELKAPALERSRLIDSEAKALTAELVALEKPIDDQIKAEERRKEAEKSAKEQAERQRAADIQQQIDNIRAHALVRAGEPSSHIARCIELLTETAITLGSFGDRAGEAQQAKTETLESLRSLHDAAVAHEAEIARMAAEREELARQRAEQEACDKAERDRLALEQKAAAEKLAAERAAFEADQAKARAEAEARDDADRSRRDEEDRKAREARAAEDKRIADARAELEAQQRAIREAEEAKEAAARKVEQDKADAAAAAERKRLDDESAAARRVNEEARAAEHKRVMDEMAAEAAAADKKRKADAKAAAKLAASQRHGPMMFDILKGSILPFLENECKGMNADAERHMVKNAIATIEEEGGAV